MLANRDLDNAGPALSLHAGLLVVWRPAIPRLFWNLILLSSFVSSSPGGTHESAENEMPLILFGREGRGDCMPISYVFSYTPLLAPISSAFEILPFIFSFMGRARVGAQD